MTPPETRKIKPLAALAGIVAAAAILLIDSPLHHFGEFGARPAAAAAVTVLMAIWWLTEALPIYLTACVPLLLYPLLGVFDGGPVQSVATTARPYVDSYIFLFMGGMCVAAAMQQCDLHRRIALTIMRGIGTDPRRLLLGLLAGTAFVSLWISNTATAAMMVPIGLAIIAQAEARLGGKRLEHYGSALMMGVAWAANIGGIGTKIGTAPNAQFCQFMSQRFGVDVTFGRFLVVGLPFVAMLLPIAWLVLWRVGRKDAPRAEVGRAAVADEIAKLGRTKRAEWLVLGVFVATAIAWICGKWITGALKPRVTAFNLTAADVEGGIAMAAALVLLVMRADGRATLELRSLRLVPWGALLLLGGAFSMAKGVEDSGLSRWLGESFAFLHDSAPFSQTMIASVATVVLTAFASNTATITVMLNVLANAASRSHVNTVLFAATIAASCDFALPAGTPPNAIVFGSGYVSVPRMAKTGALLDLLAALVAAAWCELIVARVL